MKKYRVYCLKNEDKVVYIGMTSRTLKERFSDHKKNHKHRMNYKIELLCICEDKKDAAKKEEYYIHLFDTVKNGENITYGLGTKGLKPTNAFQKGNKFGSIPKYNIICIETGDVGSAREIAEKLNIDKHKIYAICKGKRKTHKGYSFKFL